MRKRRFQDSLSLLAEDSMLSIIGATYHRHDDDDDDGDGNLSWLLSVRIFFPGQ
jgi:hypothetical protein